MPTPKTNDGIAPLHAAALTNAFATAEVLLKAGAGVNAKNNDGLYTAARGGGGGECFCDG